MNPKINYVIATYAGIYKQERANYEFVLQYHLENLLKIFKAKERLNIRNYIAQITIVCPPVIKHPIFENYYQKEKWLKIFEDKLVYIDYIGTNDFHSYDQYIQGIYRFSKNFDYHIIIEDDYVIDPLNLYFDQELLILYKSKFKTNLGYLCSWAPNYEPWLPYHAAISNGMISSDTVLLWENEKAMLLDFYNYKVHCQRAFSYLFLNKNVDIKDIADQYKILYYVTDSKDILNYSENKLSDKQIFTPIETVKIM